MLGIRFHGHSSLQLSTSFFATRKRRPSNIRLTWEAELAWFVRKRAIASSTNHDKPLTQVEAIVRMLI